MSARTEMHQTRALLDAGNMAATAFGFLNSLISSGALPDHHHGQAREIIDLANGVMKTPLFPQTFSTRESAPLETVSDTRGLSMGDGM